MKHSDTDCRTHPTSYKSQRRVPCLPTLTSTPIGDSMIAEQALADSEARFRALVTASSDVVFRMSADFRELRQLEGRMFVEESPLPNRAWFERYVFPDDRERVLVTIEDAIQRKCVF